MFSIFSEYFSTATRIPHHRMRDAARPRPDERGRFRVNRNWRELPEEF